MLTSPSSCRPSHGGFAYPSEYLPNGVPLFKHVLALGGTMVCQGRGPSSSMAWHLDVRSSVQSWPAAALLAGLPLHRWRRGLPPNRAVADSFDGRYFGPLPLTSIIGRVVPVTTVLHRRRMIPTGSYQLGKVLPDELLLTQRRNLKAKFIDLENAIRHSLKVFGIRLSKVGRGAFEQAVRAAVTDDPLSSELMDALLAACAVLWRQYCCLHDLVVKSVARSELCGRFMAIPGVGPSQQLRSYCR